MVVIDLVDTQLQISVILSLTLGNHLMTLMLYNMAIEARGKQCCGQPLYQEGAITNELIKDMSPQPAEAPILTAIIRSPENHYAERNVIDKTWTYGQQYSWMQHKYVILKNDLADGKTDSLMERLSRLEINSDVPTARYYLLVDDYCFVNTPYLLHAIKHSLPTARYILCAPRVSGPPYAATPNDCNMTLPVLVSGDVVRAVHQLKKGQTGNNFRDVSVVYYKKHLYLGAEATKLLVREYYTVGKPMNYFFSAPLFSLNSTLAMPEMIIRLWKHAETGKLAA